MGHTRGSALASRENSFSTGEAERERERGSGRGASDWSPGYRGRAAARERARARGKSIPGVKHGCTFEHSSDFMSYRGGDAVGSRALHERVSVSGRESPRERVWALTSVCLLRADVCAFRIARLLAGLQKTLLYVLLLRRGDSNNLLYMSRVLARTL